MAIGFEKFTDSTTWTCPPNVTKILVLCIGSGLSTSSSGLGSGTVIARRLAVIPNKQYDIVVGKPQSKGASPSAVTWTSFDNDVLIAKYLGNATIDGEEIPTITGLNSNELYNLKEIPKELKVKNITTYTYQSYTTTSGSAGPGMGGWYVADDESDPRTAWMQIALQPVNTRVNGRYCYPDTSKMATAASGYRAGSGAIYGGAAGRYASGRGYVSYAGVGGQGVCIIFYGDDIGDLMPIKIKYQYNETDELLYTSTKAVADEVTGKTLDKIITELQDIDVSGDIDTKLTEFKTTHVDPISTKLTALETTVNNFLTGEPDDGTIDRLKELVNAIQANKDSIDDLLLDTVKKTDIINDLTTGGADKVLSAEQGKALKGLIDGLQLGDGHTHDNADILNAISKNELTGNLTFNGKELTGETGIAISDQLSTATNYTGKIKIVVKEITPAP